MDRRSFIQTAGIGAVSLLGASSLFAGEKEQKWIRYTDQIPKVGQNIIVLYFHPLYQWSPEVSYGKASKATHNNLHVDFDNININLNQKIYDEGFKVVMGDDGYVGVGFRDIQDSVYWIPIKNKLPKFNRYEEFYRDKKQGVKYE